MDEYIVKETDRHFSTQQEVIGELIRCKDCKHWGKRGLCDKWDYYISNYDFYCGCAERRK